MTHLWFQIKRIWRSCKGITRSMIGGTIKGTSRLAKMITTTLTFTVSIVMFVVLLSGLMLTATGVSFFNVPIIRGSPPTSEQIPTPNQGGCQPV